MQVTFYVVSEQFSIARNDLVSKFQVEQYSKQSSLFTSEPSAPPVNVTAQSTSSTSISVTWGEVPADQQNGIITSYTITHTSITENHNNSITVDYRARQVNLTGLREFVFYSISVFASTVKGNGPSSNQTHVTTDQDSK